MPSKIFMRFSALDSDSEPSTPCSPVLDADAELRARFQSLCQANGLDRLFAEEDRLEAAWSGTAVQTWYDGRLVMAKPIGRVGVWGTIFESDIEEMDARAQAEWAALDHAALKAADAAAAAARRQSLIEEKVAVEARRNLKRGETVEKKHCPCARLYSCVGDKRTGGAKPTTKHVSSECWSHERICPITGALLKPHKCPWLHPGEAGWQNQWSTDRLWKPVVAPTRFENLVAAAPRPRQKTSGRDAW